MRFIKGQKVVCISKKKEWDYTVPNFDEQLKIALGVNKIPEENQIYIVDNPFELWYDNRTYIKIEGFNHNIFDEKAFMPLLENEAEERNKEKAYEAMYVNSN